MVSLDPKISAALEATRVPFELIEIEPTFSDTAAFCEKYGFTMEQSANTIIVASKKEPKQFVACVVQGTRRLDVNHALKELAGMGKLSFATADETQALTGMLIGGVTAFGLPDYLRIFVDVPLVALPWIILGGGSRDVKIKISPTVFETMPNVSVTAISTPPALPV